MVQGFIMSCENHADMKKHIEEVEAQVAGVAVRVTALEIKNAGQDEKFNRIFDMLEKIERTLEKLTEKPAKRWDTIISALLAAGVAAALAWFARGAP